LEGFLATQQLVKRFDGVAAVDSVSLSIQKGEIFALLGSSGCGKSTLLRMLAGFEVPTSGAVLLGGADIAAQPPHLRPINMMFQSYALFPHLSVWDNIAFGLRREHMPKPQLAQRVAEMLALVQLDAFAQRKPHQLSGGQQQRVALARSLAKKPQVLLLDEPLGALDKKLRERTQIELVNILQSVGVTCVMVTHDQEEAMAMATRIAVMSQGRVLQVGTPREVYEQPNCRFVADFIGNVNLLEGRVAAYDIHSGLCDVDTPQGRVQAVWQAGPDVPPADVAVAVRPEKICIAKTRPPSLANVLCGQVQEVAYFGSYNTFYVRLAADKLIKVSQTNTWRDTGALPPDAAVGQPASDTSIAQGDAVFVWWDTSAPVLLTH
jgi:putrescine transport system ATP-binding protein